MTSTDIVAPQPGIAPTASAPNRFDPRTAVKLPEEFMAQLRKIRESLHRVPLDPPDNAPENLYAEIRVGNRTIAKVYNSGCTETPNDLGYIDLKQDGQGPTLAKVRAEQIAAAIGGTIVPAETAQPQAQWDTRPPRRWAIDYDAIERDRREAEESLRRRSQRPDESVALQAQLMAQAER